MKRIKGFLENIVLIWCFTVLLVTPQYIRAQRPGNNIISPEVQRDNSVIFRLKVANADSVQVFGSWASQFKNTISMVKRDSVYEAKLGPLPSGMYEYEFVLNGVHMLDPGNDMVTRDGPWIMNRLMIPGQDADMFDAKDVPHGQVTALWCNSSTIGMQRRMYVYTPPGYETDKKQYPVLYLLHGAGADEEAWLSRGRANYLLDNLIAQDKATPMIIVFTNGNVTTPAASLDRSIDKEKTVTEGVVPMISEKFEESFVKDIVPYIEKNYRVIADAGHRAIAGFSMGGYHTEMISNSNSTMFKYIGVMSMGLFSSFGNFNTGYDKDKHIAQLKALIAAKPKLYWIGIGKEDFLYGTVTKLRSLYDEVGLKYTYVESEGRHDWNSWRLYLSEFAPLLFK
jgi:enterochelin esterase family protein